MTEISMDALLKLYREGLGESVTELGGHRDALVGGDKTAAAEIRRLAHTIHGSGGTYGLPHLSACAWLLEEAEDNALLRRADGFERTLRRAAQPFDPGTWHPWAWLRRIAGLDPQASDRAGAWDSSERSSSLASAWRRIAEEAGLDARELLGRVSAEYEVKSLDEIAGVAWDEAALPAGTGTRLGVRMLADGGRGGLRAALADPADLDIELVLERVLGEQPILVVVTPESLDQLPSNREK